jgi:hypothetical protein
MPDVSGDEWTAAMKTKRRAVLAALLEAAVRVAVAMLLAEAFEHEDGRDRLIGFRRDCWTLDEAEPFKQPSNHRRQPVAADWD